MKKALRTLRNYICYCGIEKDEYNAIKKDAYVSNFKVWRILHILMAAVFAFLYIGSLLFDLMSANSLIYLVSLIYSVGASVYFFIAKPDSLIPQFIIYLSISLLFVFGCLITQNRPDVPATTFIAFLLVSPMFMIDKPFFMAIELSCASTVFLIWMYLVKPSDVWMIDFTDVIIFTLVGIFLHIIANAIRIREFVLTKTIRLQKDMDDLTGIKNKGALTREINEFLADHTTNKGMLFIMDVDKFKSINDTLGHDIGDSVIKQIGAFLGEKFNDGNIAGRFGGDEFIVFIKDSNDAELASRTADEIVKGVYDTVFLPDHERKVSVSVGVARYFGLEKNYSELLKKADTALYRAKGDSNKRFYIYE